MPLTTEQIETLKKITSPSVANAIETFKVRPREEGNVSSEIRGLFPELGPLVGYAATCRVKSSNPSLTGSAYDDRTDWWAAIQLVTRVWSGTMRPTSPPSTGCRASPTTSERGWLLSGYA